MRSAGMHVGRRQVVGGMVGLGMLGLAPRRAVAAAEQLTKTVTRMKFYFDDPEFDGQLQRTATAAYSGSADLGEMLVAAAKVKPGDNDSWWTAWSEMAERAEGAANDSASR